MGMFSEIATESTICGFVFEIKKMLKAHDNKPEAIRALKEIGRFALTQFEWSEPDWTGEYHDLFRE